MDELINGFGAVLGTVTGASKSKATATIEDATGREVTIEGCDEADLQALGNQFGRMVLVKGLATFSKGGRILSIADVTVLPWDPPAVEVQE